VLGAWQVDVEFVRRSVRAIGRTAIKLERAAERCINVLLELIQTKVNYVVQEAIIVIKDIFRRWGSALVSRRAAVPSGRSLHFHLN
jgi:AP-1 complex subunit beta-1